MKGLHNFCLIVISILCVTIMVVYANSKGIDGKALATGIGVIGYITGYYFKNRKKRGE